MKTLTAPPSALAAAAVPSYADFLASASADLGQCPVGNDVLGHVLAHPTLLHEGTWAEFGVASGKSLRRLVAARAAARVWGFDSFVGLEKAWHDMPKGAFAMGGVPPAVPGAHIVTGFFRDTLPYWRTPHGRRDLTLLHIDCDLYEGAADALRACLPFLHPRAIVIFDEIQGYPSYAEHEMKALYEATFAWARSPVPAGGWPNGFRWTWIACGTAGSQAAAIQLHP